MNNVLHIASETKVCSKCGEAKGLTNYKPAGFHSTGIAKICNDCVAIKRNAIWEKKRAAAAATRAAMTHKECNVCGYVKPLSDFNKDKTHLDGLQSECRECRKTRNRTNRAKSFESAEARKTYLEKKKKYNRSQKYYENYFMKRFGVTYDYVKSLYDAQLGRCANKTCHKEITFYHDNESGRAHPNRACLDHDHNNGKVRALLCMSCNTILGTLETRGNIITGLMEYLAFFRAKTP